MTNNTILLVDDEEKVLSSLSRILDDEDFSEIKTARNGHEALEVIKIIPNLSVIVSDYHMPGMNGIDFLVEARSISPDTSRVLLTGVADLEMAVNAVNRGNVFRFLIKPCSTEVFLGAVRDGIRYNQLITGERDLLSKTLNGSIKLMIDILAIQNPLIFAQASRLRMLGHDLAIALQIEEQSWEIELAALLCQIGAVTIPVEIIERWQNRILLKDSELDMIRTIPQMGHQLIKNIPRLEKIAEAIEYQSCPYSGQINTKDPTGDDIPLLARILKIIMDFDWIQENTIDAKSTLKVMLKRKLEYDPRILGLFGSKVLHIQKPSSDKIHKSKNDENETFVGGAGTTLQSMLGQPSEYNSRIRGLFHTKVMGRDEYSTRKTTKSKKVEEEVFVEWLEPGMVITRDVFDNNGILIISSRTVINDVILYKLINYFHSQSIVKTIFVERPA